jgi:hypothetical protein
MKKTVAAIVFFVLVLLFLGVRQVKTAAHTAPSTTPIVDTFKTAPTVQFTSLFSLPKLPKIFGTKPTLKPLPRPVSIGELKFSENENLAAIGEAMDNDIIGGLETRDPEFEACLKEANGVTQSAPVGTVWKWTLNLEILPSEDGSSATIIRASSYDWPPDFSEAVKDCHIKVYEGIEIDQRIPQMTLKYPFTFVISPNPAK